MSTHPSERYGSAAATTCVYMQPLDELWCLLNSVSWRESRPQQHLHRCGSSHRYNTYFYMDWYYNTVPTCTRKCFREILRFPHSCHSSSRLPYMNVTRFKTIEDILQFTLFLSDKPAEEPVVRQVFDSITRKCGHGSLQIHQTQPEVGLHRIDSRFKMFIVTPVVQVHSCESLLFGGSTKEMVNCN